MYVYINSSSPTVISNFHAKSIEESLEQHESNKTLSNLFTFYLKIIMPSRVNSNKCSLYNTPRLQTVEKATTLLQKQQHCHTCTACFVIEYEAPIGAGILPATLDVTTIYKTDCYCSCAQQRIMSEDNQKYNWCMVIILKNCNLFIKLSL